MDELNIYHVVLMGVLFSGCGHEAETAQPKQTDDPRNQEEITLPASHTKQGGKWITLKNEEAGVKIHTFDKDGDGPEVGEH